MAADLHIHIRTKDIGEDVMDLFFANNIGSKRFKGIDSILSIKEQKDLDDSIKEKYNGKDEYEIISSAPSVFVGECSFLKAALFEDDSFVPEPVGVISELFNDEPLIDDKLIEDVEKAMTLPNNTGYSLGNGEEILELLKKHKGLHAFTVAW